MQTAVLLANIRQPEVGLGWQGVRDIFGMHHFSQEADEA